MKDLSERMATVETQLIAMAFAREELRSTLSSMDDKLELLLASKARYDGALGLGRWLIGIGLPTLVGGTVLWFLDFMAGGSK